MKTAIIITVYFLGAFVFCRYFVAMHARKFPYIGWELLETIICLLFAILWPLASLMFGVLELLWFIQSHNPRTVLPFKKWHGIAVEKRRAK